MLTLDKVNTYYGASHVLHDLSLEVEKGKVTVLLGRNGMGKTTTIHTVMGITPSKNGKIMLLGKEIQNLSSFQISRAGVGLVPQGRKIFPNLTVKENLITTYRPLKKGWELQNIYEMFPRLYERENSMGGHLSGGEQQMLSIGRALLTNPSLLLLDEPSEGLSPLMVAEVIKIIKILKEKGLTMFLVEQNLSMALELADYVYILNKGAVAFAGKPEDLTSEMKAKHLALSS